MPDNKVQYEITGTANTGPIEQTGKSVGTLRDGVKAFSREVGAIPGLGPILAAFRNPWVALASAVGLAVSAVKNYIDKVNADYRSALNAAQIGQQEAKLTNLWKEADTAAKAYADSLQQIMGRQQTVTEQHTAETKAIQDQRQRVEELADAQFALAKARVQASTASPEEKARAETELDIQQTAAKAARQIGYAATDAERQKKYAEDLDRSAKAEAAKAGALGKQLPALRAKALQDDRVLKGLDVEKRRAELTGALDEASFIRETEARMEKFIGIRSTALPGYDKKVDEAKRNIELFEMSVGQAEWLAKSANDRVARLEKTLAETQGRAGGYAEAARSAGFTAQNMAGDRDAKQASLAEVARTKTETENVQARARTRDSLLAERSRVLGWRDTLTQAESDRARTGDQARYDETRQSVARSVAESSSELNRLGETLGRSMDSFAVSTKTLRNRLDAIERRLKELER